MELVLMVKMAKAKEQFNVGEIIHKSFGRDQRKREFEDTEKEEQIFSYCHYEEVLFPF